MFSLLDHWSTNTAQGTVLYIDIRFARLSKNYAIWNWRQTSDQWPAARPSTAKVRALMENARVEFNRVQKQLRQIEHDHHPKSKNRPTDSLIHFDGVG